MHGNFNIAKLDLIEHGQKTDAPTREEMARLEDKYEAGEIDDQTMEELRESYEQAKAMEREAFDK